MVATKVGQTVGIKLRFAPGASDNSLVAEALDGGTIAQGQATSSLSADGTTSLQYQLGTSTGLYRVLLNQGGNVNVLQFWIPDAGNAATNASAVQPSTGN
jgi:hypothetical protein